MSYKASRIAAAELILGYTFKNKEFLWEAIQAPGRLNEKLALVGNADIRLVLHRKSYDLGKIKGIFSLALELASPKS